MIPFREQRRFLTFLAAVVLLHALLLLIPAARDSLQRTNVVDSLTVRLRHTPPAIEVPMREPEATAPMPAPEPSNRPIELAEQPSPAPVVPLPQPEPEPPASTVNTPQVLSWQFEYSDSRPLFGPAQDIAEDRPDYYVRARPSLDDVLNEPSLQLPFADTRIYLVDSYDPGFAGSVQRFFDDVTVPFGWTTKNNTRVQCGWILVVAGCSWGHNSLFHKKAKKREAFLTD